MSTLCLSTNLSPADAAAWASFAATLLGAIGTLAAVYAAFIVGRRQERVAETMRQRDRQQAHYRGFVLCRLAIHETRMVLQAAHDTFWSGDQHPLKDTALAMRSACELLNDCVRGDGATELLPLIWRARMIAGRALIWLSSDSPATGDHAKNLAISDLEKLAKMAADVDKGVELLGALGAGAERDFALERHEGK